MASFKMTIKVFQLSAVGYSAQEHEKKMRRERISVKNSEHLRTGAFTPYVVLGKTFCGPGAMTNPQKVKLTLEQAMKAERYSSTLSLTSALDESGCFTREKKPQSPCPTTPL